MCRATVHPCEFPLTSHRCPNLSARILILVFTYPISPHAGLVVLLGLQATADGFPTRNIRIGGLAQSKLFGDIYLRILGT
jgi:hypothetical protein